MYYITYIFNESAIITVAAKSIAISEEVFSFADRNGVGHQLSPDSLISIVPVRHIRRRSTTPKAPQS
jgi:hypothetical protein